MKLERISETQIKCTLTSLDLSARNVNLRELTYGSEKARNLFAEMMQKACTELGFEADGTPLMVEAIPLRDESIVLVITKVEEPEEIDTRFSRFSQQNAAAPEGYLRNPFDGAGAGRPIPAGAKRAFVFEDLDTVSEAAKALCGRYTAANSLYKNPENKKYYLILEGEGTDDAVFQSTCSLLSEYSKIGYYNAGGTAYLTEHYETIIPGKALEVLAKL